MQVAKYWRNKQLRYRLERARRITLAAGPTLGRQRVAAAGERDHRRVAVELAK